MSSNSLSSEDSKNTPLAESLASSLGSQTGIDEKTLIGAALRVIKADGVLIVLPSKGYSLDKDKYTNYILEVAKQLDKKTQIIYLDKGANQCLKWMSDNKVERVYPTGPREEDSPGIYERSKVFFELFYGKLKSLTIK